MKNIFFTTSRKQNQSDEELLALYKSTSNQHWLGLLYERYMHLAYGLCLKHYKDTERSKEAVMQIYEKLAEEVLKHEINYFKSWLYVLVKNFCLMDLRKESNMRNNYLKKIEAEFMESTYVSHPIDEEQDETMQKALKYCIEQLKDIQRICVQRFYYDKKCYKEIAEEYHLTENNVKSFIQNGKRNLKICIEGRMVA